MDARELIEKHMSIRDRLGDAVSVSDVYDRCTGTEFTQWEKQLLTGFEEHVRGPYYRYRGFVRHTRNKSLVLVTPSPWIIEGTFVYLPDKLAPPDEGEMIEVFGRNIASPSHLSRSNKTIRTILAESIEHQSMSFLSETRPPLSLKELSNMLFEHVGMPESSKRVFARLYVSSPPYLDSVGGLTTGIQALASKPQIRRLLRFMKDILPPSLRSARRKSQSVQGIQVSLPKLWRLDVGQINSQKMDAICVQRRDPSGFREVSLSSLTDSSTAALPDIPLTLTTEDFWIERTSPRELRLPILKSAITFQMFTPMISQKSVDTSTSYVIERLEHLKDSFDLEDGSLSKGHLLDANLFGRPLSTIRLARSAARAYGKEKVTARDVKHEWKDILEPALREYIEIASLNEETTKDWGEEHPTYKYNSKILRSLRRLDTGKSGSLGPTLKELSEESGVPVYETAKELSKMKDDGVVYEPRPGHFRLV